MKKIRPFPIDKQLHGYVQSLKEMLSLTGELKPVQPLPPPVDKKKPALRIV